MLARFKPVFLVVAAFATCWAGVIWYWRASHREPGTGDLVAWLLVLPLALVLAAWLVRKTHARMTAPAAAGAVPAVTAAATQPAAALPAALAIVAASVRAPHGEAASDVRALIAEGRARPQLDDELLDDQGFPALTGRIAGNDPAALQAELLPWLAAQGSDEDAFSTAQWRALNAGTSVLTELAAMLAMHPQLAQHAARSDPRTPSPLPMLRLLPVWPAAWAETTRTLAEGWLRHLLLQAGWPNERLASAPAAGTASADVTALLATLLAQAGEAAGAPVLAVVLACDSALDEAAVDALAERGALFTARDAQGIVPGEGAAAVLLADPAQAALLAPGEPVVLLRGAASARLPDSADAGKRPDPQVLPALVTGLLDRVQCDAASVAALTADTDHRRNRTMELMDLVTNGFKQLDPGADVVSVGAACGHGGAASYLTALALARHDAAERGAPVLCIGNLDPYRRDAALLAPGTEV